MYVYHTFNDQFFSSSCWVCLSHLGDVATVKARIASAFFALMDEISNRLPRRH